MERAMIQFKNDTSGFYKLGNQPNCLIYGITIDELNVTKENYQEYQYPLNEWYWFDSCELARTFWELPEAEIITTFNPDYSQLDPLILRPSLRPKYGEE
jgi:hypothetical protein